MLHWRGAISKTFQRFIFRLHDYAGNLLFNFWSRKKEKLINFIIAYFAIYFKQIIFLKNRSIRNESQAHLSRNTLYTHTCTCRARAGVEAAEP